MMQRQGQLGADGTPVRERRAAARARRAKQERTSPVEFLREVRGELRKVAWPTRSEVVNYSIIVLIAVVHAHRARSPVLDWLFGSGDPPDAATTRHRATDGCTDRRPGRRRSTSRDTATPPAPTCRSRSSRRRRSMPTSRRSSTPRAEADDEDDAEVAPARRARTTGPAAGIVVHTQSGYEKKVKPNLEARIQSMNMEEKIFEVVIPMEDVVEFKNGRKVVVQKKVFPGYLLVRCEMDDDSWYVIRNTPGVTGFVGQAAARSPRRCPAARSRRSCRSRATATSRAKRAQAAPRVRGGRERAGQGRPVRRLLRRRSPRSTPTSSS